MNPHMDLNYLMQEAVGIRYIRPSLTIYSYGHVITEGAIERSLSDIKFKPKQNKQEVLYWILFQLKVASSATKISNVYFSLLHNKWKKFLVWIKLSYGKLKSLPVLVEKR